MTGKTQAEAVSILRKVPSGSKVKIVVSRQEDVISQVVQKSSQVSYPIALITLTYALL